MHAPNCTIATASTVAFSADWAATGQATWTVSAAPIQVRKQELVQAAVRQLGVGLDPRPADHVHALGSGDRDSMVEKDRFPDARRAPQPQRAAAFAARICQQAMNPGSLDAVRG